MHIDWFHSLLPRSLSRFDRSNSLISSYLFVFMGLVILAAILCPFSLIIEFFTIFIFFIKLQGHNKGRQIPERNDLIFFYYIFALQIEYSTIRAMESISMTMHKYRPFLSHHAMFTLILFFFHPLFSNDWMNIYVKCGAQNRFLLTSFVHRNDFLYSFRVNGLWLRSWCWQKTIFHWCTASDKPLIWA